MKLSIDQRIFETFEDPQIGVVVVRGADNAGESAEVVELLRSAEEGVRQAFVGIDPITTQPNIAVWRKAYKKFGVDPHEYRSSIEALVRRVLKGGAIPHINKLVDVYNYISLKYLVPVGGEDLDAAKGDMALTFAIGDEQFVRLGGTENEPPLPGEVIYRDELGVLCRRWNWREADRTKLTEGTRDAILVIEALSPIDLATVQQATQELAELVQRHCSAKTTSFIVNKGNAVIEF